MTDGVITKTPVRLSNASGPGVDAPGPLFSCIIPAGEERASLASGVPSPAGRLP